MSDPFYAIFNGPKLVYVSQTSELAHAIAEHEHLKSDDTKVRAFEIISERPHDVAAQIAEMVKFTFDNSYGRKGMKAHAAAGHIVRPISLFTDGNAIVADGY